MKTIKYMNFNFTKILGVNKYEVMRLSSFIKIKHIIRMFISNVLKKYKFEISNQNEIDFIFFKIQNRDDYNLLFENIYNQCAYMSKAILTLNRVYGLNIKYLINTVSNLRLLYLLLKECSFLDSTYYYILANRYIEIMRQIDNYSFKTLIVFSDVQPIENILVQYCNMKNIKTVTMQHGLYIDYNDMPNINMLNYIDVSSKCLLAWGESTEELFKKYNEEIEISICGKPISLNQSCSEKDNNLIGVVFDQPMFRDFNKIMLRIAYKIALQKNMKVVVRLHPQDDHKYYDYDINLTQLESDASKASYILAHTTSMIYEYLALGYKVFKLRSDVPANEIDESLKFSSAEELEKKLDMNFDFQQESSRHIRYVGDESKIKYKEFFDKLHDNNLEINNNLE